MASARDIPSGIRRRIREALRQARWWGKPRASVLPDLPNEFMMYALMVGLLIGWAVGVGTGLGISLILVSRAAHTARRGDR